MLRYKLPSFPTSLYVVALLVASITVNYTGTISATDATEEEELLCIEHCDLFFKALGRCPYTVPDPPEDFDDCVETCLLASYSKDGTKQDFILRDTLQCRNNHALMAIKEGSLTNSLHCLHATVSGPERCATDEVSLTTAEEEQQGEFFFYYPSVALATDDVDQIIQVYIAAVSFLITRRGRLWTTYPYLELGGPDDTGNPCDGLDLRYRTADGTCNNLDMPLMGSVGTQFVRSSMGSAPHPEGYADAKRIAKILKRPETIGPDRLAPFNLLATAWIQFMTHDWFQHDVTASGGVLKNRVTHWWDASQIYGSSQDEANSIRVAGGKILLDKNDELDYNSMDQPLTGFGDNFWVGLHVMHTVFAREHNWIVDQLKAEYPGMSANELYGTARNCVSAILAKIHTLEWTPTLLDNDLSTFGLTANWIGLQNAIASVFTPEQVAPYADLVGSFQVPHVGGPYPSSLTMFNTSFFMTEEFVSAYRMHQLLPDNLSVRGKSYKLRQLSFIDARKLVKDDTTKELLVALASSPSRILSLQNYPRELYDLKVPGRGAPFDLAELELIRDRERNLPRYNDARRQLLLEPYTSLDDLTDDEYERELLKSVYTDIDQVDFMVGCLVDKDRPEGFAFGAVPYYIFLVMASRRLLSDRFLLEGLNENNYTPWGLQYVAGLKFKSVLDRHFPELSSYIPSNPFSNDWTVPVEPTCDPTDAVKLELWNADDDVKIGMLGNKIDLCTYDMGLTIVATPSCKEKVKFKLMIKGEEGHVTKQAEVVPPMALGGDNGDDVLPVPALRVPGSYTLMVNSSPGMKEYFEFKVVAENC